MRVVSGEVALESFFRQSAQEVAAFVSDCYAECQALGVASEADQFECYKGSWSCLCLVPTFGGVLLCNAGVSSLFLPVCLRCNQGCWSLGG